MPASSPPPVPHRVPRTFTSLVGRDREITTVCDLILTPEIRLLTLTGPGGIGKTRLSIEVAERLQSEFGDEVYWVALAPITDPGLVMSTIGLSLGIGDLGQQSVEDQLRDYLQERRSLIVIDNFEQVSEAAPRIADLLSQCTNISILVTSRLPLRIQGEQQFPVQPLALPQPDGAVSVDDVQRTNSGRLFIERAQSARPDFGLTPDNAPAIADLCRQLEGVPLAIELAAARITVLSPQGMLARLDPSLPLLVGGPRDQPSRLQTMRGAIQWSWDLLSPAEQALLRRMAVFRGGSSLESVEAVAGTDLSGTLLDTLSTLIDHNLIRSEEDPDGEPRFDMLVVVREFALEELESSDEAEMIRKRHGAYITTLAETATEHYGGPEATYWFDRMEREHDNLRAALEFFLDTGAAHEMLLLSKAARLFWYTRAHLREGRRWLELALNNDDGTDLPLRAIALSGLADLVHEQGDHQYSRRIAAEALEISRQTQDTPSTISALLNFGVALWMLGETSVAHAQWEEALALARTAGRIYDVEITTFLLSYSALILGDVAQATCLSEECLALARDLDDKLGIACAFIVQGWLAAHDGNYEHAWTLLCDSFQLSHEIGDLARVTYAVNGLAAVSAMRNQASQAAYLAGASAAIQKAIGRPIPPPERVLHDEHFAAARAQLGASDWNLHFARGQTMTLDEALALASAPYFQQTVDSQNQHGLTPRQIEMLRLIADGHSDKEIAERLYISPHTVMRHVANILNTLGVDSRTAAASYALRSNVI